MIFVFGGVMGDPRQPERPSVAYHDAPVPHATPDAMIAIARAAFDQGENVLCAALDSLPVPTYLTDADGWVTHFNRACIDFAGRIPEPGKDRWCVTWRLYSEGGAFVPTEDCPMAVAIHDKAPVRGIIAVAERPDGKRVTFLPYPTPIIDDAGALIGAINLFIDVTDGWQADALGAQAARCRRLAESISDARTIATLSDMARDYEEKADALR